MRTVRQGHSSQWQVWLCGTVLFLKSPRLLYGVSKIRDFPCRHEDFWQSELHQDSCGDKFCQGLLKGGLAVLKRPHRHFMFLCQEWTRNGFFKCHISSFPHYSVPVGQRALTKRNSLEVQDRNRNRRLPSDVPVPCWENVLTAVKRRDFWKW